MKKKIIIILTTLAIIITVWAVVNYRQNKTSSDEDDLKWNSEIRAKVIYEIDGEYNSASAGGMYVYDDQTDNIHLDVKLEQGAILVSVYDWNDPEIDPHIFAEAPQEYLVQSERITESGSYDYNLDYLPAGHYWVVIDEEKTDDRDKMTVGEADIVLSNKY